MQGAHAAQNGCCNTGKKQINDQSAIQIIRCQAKVGSDCDTWWRVNSNHHVAGKDMCVGFLCIGGGCHKIAASGSGETAKEQLQIFLFVLSGRTVGTGPVAPSYSHPGNLSYHSYQ
jgi:hypothetical protein